MTDDVRAAVDAWLGRDGTEAGRGDLLARLAADPPFRRAVAAELHLVGLLQVVRAGEPRWLRLEDELGDPTAADPDAGFESAVMGRVHAEPAGPGRRVVTAVVVGLVALAVGLAVPPAAPPPADAVEPPPEPAAEVIGSVVASDDAAWDAAPVSGVVLAGQAVRLRAGKVAFSLVNGVVLAAEGPADFDLVSVARVFCRRGKLRADVPPAAHGFTIQCAGAAVVDRGAEIGVNVGPDGRAEVLALRGLADVSLIEAGRPVAPESVLTGRAVEIDPAAATIRSTPADPGRFTTAAAPTVPRLRLGPAYHAAVARSRPWAAWRFDRTEGDRIPSDVPGRPNLIPSGGVAVADGVAVFRPDGPDQGLLADAPWTPPRADGYAVELWFLADRYQRAALAGLTDGPPGAEGYAMYAELINGTWGSFSRPCAVRGLDRWPPGQYWGTNVFSDQSYVPNRWHHLVVQRAEGRSQLVLDGAAVETAASPSSDTGPVRLLLGRLRTGGPKAGSDFRPFVGRLAGVALYDHLLTPDDIQAHLAAGRRD